MSDSGAGKKVLVSGGSGFIGRVVCERFSAADWQVSTLTRGADDPAKHRIHWDPAAGELDASSVSGFDAIVHLAGESIVGRWTDKKKQSVMQTRREGTALLATAAATAASKPAVFISASAIGFYGSRGDEVLTEDSGNGDGFLAEVCSAWEQGTAPASDAGIRVVNLRIGLVLGKGGGIIGNTSTPFKLGVGGKLGSGDQWYSWV
ncbi:MAG: NAD-dependent epimerase/dehydratase family protein, partial [Thermoleophilaceae bacterium]|nr:NAD-dependent epimerase/dehydratase family protein [Thermoleophilaceae bacterium]